MVLAATPLAVQAAPATTGLVWSVTQRALAAWASFLAMSIPRTTATGTAVLVSAVFCESP